MMYRERMDETEGKRKTQRQRILDFVAKWRKWHGASVLAYLAKTLQSSLNIRIMNVIVYCKTYRMNIQAKATEGKKQSEGRKIIKDFL